MRSVVVVLPASTCAMIPMLRMSLRGVVRAIAKFRLDSEGWAGETPARGDFRGADGSEKRENLLGRVGIGRVHEKSQQNRGISLPSSLLNPADQTLIATNPLREAGKSRAE